MVILNEIVFHEKYFEIVETRKGDDRLPVDQLEKYGIFDPNKYKKLDLLLMFGNFIRRNNFMNF